MSQAEVLVDNLLGVTLGNENRPDLPLEKPLRVAIVGGGPAALYVLKEIVGSKMAASVSIYEAGPRLGQGMPYSTAGANPEHVTNISSIETPELIRSLHDWMQSAPAELLGRYGVTKEKWSQYRVVPRLLFGKYLGEQFETLLTLAENSGIRTESLMTTRVQDLRLKADRTCVFVAADGQTEREFDVVVICTGHCWPVAHEGTIPGFFDSPYPPRKLSIRANHQVAFRGSSLTAIDAMRTLARANGEFVRESEEKLRFVPSHASPDFKIKMHSREGFLPAIRFHLEDPQLRRDSLLSPDDLESHRTENDGFVALDYVFDQDFKRFFAERDPDFYDQIRNMQLEEFVELMLRERETTDPFEFFLREYMEALASIQNRRTIYWKERLTILSIAMNGPAKYFSAEDRLRLRDHLMPLISLVIASTPQISCQEVLALHEAGRLELIALGPDCHHSPNPNGGVFYHYQGKDSVGYKTFVDCTGQPHLPFAEFPFRSLIEDNTVSPAKLRFKDSSTGQRIKGDGDPNVELREDASYMLRVPGLAINDQFQVVDPGDRPCNRIYLMAVPFIGGYNPDYSGLDFCEEASKKVVDAISEHQSLSA